MTFQRKLLLGFSLMALPALLVGAEAIRSNVLERRALTALEAAATHVGVGGQVGTEEARGALQKRFAHYDKSGEEHYNLISAYHKALRGSDPQGALYWLARMIEGGEDPMYIARRTVRFAAEDVGLAEVYDL